MALKKTVKSVLLHDGMGDDSDRFLLEPPAVDYAENLRIDKTGSLQKRPGFGPDALGTVPNATGDPIAFQASGDNLHVLVEEGARTWDGTSWEEVDVAGFLGSSSLELESQNFVGSSCFSYEPFVLNNEVVGHVIAYEVREQNSEASRLVDSEKHVIIQRYDAGGKFLDQRRYDNARTPQAASSSLLGVVSVFFQDITSGQIRLVPASAPPLGVDLPDPTNTAHIAADQPYLPAHAQVENGPRLGQGVLGQARYLVEFYDQGQTYMVAYLQPDGDLYLSEINTAGSTLDNTQVAANTINPDLLALNVAGPIVDLVFQYWDTNITTLHGVVASRFTAFDLRIAPTEQTLRLSISPSKARMFTHGTVATSDDLSKSFVAVHSSGYNSRSQDTGAAGPPNQGPADYWWPYSNRDKDVGLYTYEVEWGVALVSDYANLSSHRLTTKACYFDGDWYAGVQQWLDYTPHHPNPGACNAYVDVFPATKPVTTAICIFKRDVVQPVASIDAGLSSHIDYTESEIDIHLGTLREEGGDLLVSNRVKLRAEDINLYYGAETSNWHRRSNVEVSSDSLCRVHRIRKGGAGINGTFLGDGMVLSTALPTWFDGRFIAEFGPLDSPEIIRVEDADYTTEGPTGPGNAVFMENAPPQGYSAMKDTTRIIKWRKFAAIYGYVDTRGNTHRSAPSATFYVGDLQENVPTTATGQPFPTAWVGREITVWVTRPLTVVPSGVEYFVEIYVSSKEDTDMQLAAQGTIDTSKAYDQVALTFQLNRPQATDTHTTIPVLRSTEAPYTSGNILAADPWPSFTYSVATSTRFWAIDAINRGRVLPSKLFEDFIAPEYNPTLAINLGDERDLTAIGKLDDKVVVFEPNDIHVIYGDGPDNRGQGQDFAVHYIATDVGCEDQESVIECPTGLIFYSKPRGFYLLDRNLQVQFIGGGIEDTTRGIDIISATLVRDRAEVRFAFTGGPPHRFGPTPDTFEVDKPATFTVFTNVPPTRDPALTYNYERNSWLTFSNYDAQAATIYQQKYTMLRSDWTVWQESEDRWDDPEGANRSLIVTPWIRLSEQVQGFNRLYRMTFLGRYLSALRDLGTNEYEAGDIYVEVYYDYEAWPTQEKRFRLQDFGFDPFNNPPKRAERLQFELSPKRGRCQAVKLKIYEVNTEDMGENLTYKQGRGFEISSIDFEMGVAPSRALLPAAVKK